MDAHSVAGYLLFNPGFPASMACCAEALKDLLDGLKPYVGPSKVNACLRQVRPLNRLVRAGADQLDDDNRHMFLDGVQRQLASLDGEISRQFFAR